MASSPLAELQKRAGAKMGDDQSQHLPSAYTSSADEYDAATVGAGLVDRSDTGRLKLNGSDALDLLNRLSTNKLEDLEAGRGMHTVLTSNKGRILDLLFVLMQSDHLMVLTSPECRQKVADWIDFYTFVEEVVIEDVTERTTMLGVLGPKAAEVLGRFSGQEISPLSTYESVSSNIGDVDALVIRTDFAGLPGYDVIVPASQAEQLWTMLVEGEGGSGATPVGTDALEVVRVEQGAPVYGRELSEDYNPLEADLLEFVSFNKGCYIGQEVVTRLDTYEKVQKHLVGLSWDSDETPASNCSLTLEGKKVGGITTAVTSPRLRRGIGLGYVKKSQARPGVQLAAGSSGGEIEVTVEELPFKLTSD